MADIWTAFVALVWSWPAAVLALSVAGTAAYTRSTREP